MTRLTVISALVLGLAVSAAAQVVGVVPIPLPPVPVTGLAGTVIDQNGNLLVFETRYTFPAGTNLNSRILRVSPTPTTRITPVLASGTAGTAREYAGVTLQVVGVGRWGVYAILTAISTDQNNRTLVTRRLAVINAGVSGTSLPDNANGFVSTELAPNVGQIDVARSPDQSPDTLYAAVSSYPVVLLTPNVGTFPPAPGSGRKVTIYKYAGGQFSSADVPLP
jgi:hypothetical protein